MKFLSVAAFPLNPISPKTTKKPNDLVGQLGYDGAGNPAISLKPLTLREKTHYVWQATAMCLVCQEIAPGFWNSIRI